MAIERQPREEQLPGGVTATGGQLIQLVSALARPADRARDGEGLSEEELRYRAFLEALGVAVYTTDAAGHITYFNRAAASFWGRSPALGEEWCGSWRLYHADGTPMRHEDCPMAVALKENRLVRGEEAIAERPDGTRVSFVPYPTPLRDSTGTLVGAVNVLVDITQRREAEQALRASNAVKDEFLGLVSHELRTPVTTIFGNAQLLRARAATLSDETRASMVEDIAEDSERLLSIIENLLLLTRLESGPQTDLEPQVLTHIVRKSVDSFRKRHRGRRVRLTTVPRHVVVEADRTYLELTLDNLLSNADKYSPRDAVIEVVVRITEDEAQVLVLDRGIGLTEEEAGQVFTAFYRTDRAKTKANGIGIGLAVCRRMLETQGGRIWARARKGGGSVFGFALPVARESA